MSKTQTRTPRGKTSKTNFERATITIDTTPATKQAPDRAEVNAARRQREAERARASMVNKQWFISRLEDQSMSMRDLAKRMDLDVSALSLMFSGRRRITANEAGQLAHHLQESVEEVLKRAGVVVAETKGWSIPIKVVVDGSGRLVSPPEWVGPRAVERPTGLGQQVQAVRVQGGRWDGWVLYYRGARSHVVEPEAVGQLCVVRIVGQDGEWVRWVRRGYEAGTWLLVPLDGEGSLEARLLSATPVLWMKQ